MSIFKDMLIYNAKIKKVGYSSSASSFITKTITLNLTEYSTEEKTFAYIRTVASGSISIKILKDSISTSAPEILLKDENDKTIATFDFSTSAGNSSRKTVSVQALHQYKLTYKCPNENVELPSSVIITYYEIDDNNLVSVRSV